MTLPTGNLLRAARALAGLRSAQLAALAKIDQSTLSRMESTGRKPVRGHAGTVDSVVRTLKAHGVRISDDPAGECLEKKAPRR
jgi:transcriptional regulator with XRE-family HTH domain